MKRLPRRPIQWEVLAQVTAGVLAWEFVAIELRHEKIPTFSALAGRHRWIAPTLLIALAVHLWWPIPGQDEHSLLGSQR